MKMEHVFSWLPCHFKEAPEQTTVSFKVVRNFYKMYVSKKIAYNTCKTGTVLNQPLRLKLLLFMFHDKKPLSNVMLQ